MSKTTFIGYVPSLKAKHKATITEGKAIESKGGSIRYTIQGLYDGRKTFPKTVTKADFENVYGFDAKEAEAVIITGKEGKEDGVQLHIVGIEDNMDFTPEKIVPIKTMNEYGHKKLEKEIMGGHATKSNHAETVVGSPSPADVEPPAPSEKPFPQEPTNENFSADKDYAYEPTDEEMAEIWEREQKMRDLEPTELLEDDDYTTLEGTLEKEAFLGFGDDEKEEKEEEKPKEQEFTVVLQEGDRLELTDIEEDDTEVGGPKDEDNGEDSENDEKEAESYKAVSAKVTRPVKEEPKEEEPEDEEGMSTLMKVGLGAAALAVGAAVFGAEMVYCSVCKDEIGTEQEVYDEESVEWYNIDGQEVCAECKTETTAEGVCGCGIDCVCDCGCAESGVCNCGESCPCDCGCGVESFETESLVEEPDWIPDGDGRALGQQNLDINLSPLHAEQNEYHTSNVFYADGEDLTSSEFVPFDQITSEIQQEWDETTVPVAADYEPSNEPTNANFSAEETSMKQGWTITHFGDKRDTRMAKKDGLAVMIEKIRHGATPRYRRRGANWRVTYGRYINDGSGGRIIPIAELFPTYNDIFTWLNNPPFTIHNHAETVGSPSPTFNEEYAYEPTDEEMAKIWEREQKIREMEPTELLEDDDYTTLEGTLDAENFSADGSTSFEELKARQKKGTLEKEIAKKNDWVIEIRKANIWEGDNSIKCPNCKDNLNANWAIDSWDMGQYYQYDNLSDEQKKAALIRFPRGIVCFQCGTVIQLYRDDNAVWGKGGMWTHPKNAETVGSPSPTFNEDITGQDGPSAEPTNADFSAEDSCLWCEEGTKGNYRHEGRPTDYCSSFCYNRGELGIEEGYAETTGLSKNAQYAIGLLTLGVGIALWNGDWVSKMFDRFKR